VHVITFLLFVLIVTTTPVLLGWGEMTESADFVDGTEGVGSE
jgi:hypothetical protein